MQEHFHTILLISLNMSLNIRTRHQFNKHYTSNYKHEIQVFNIFKTKIDIKGLELRMRNSMKGYKPCHLQPHQAQQS